MFYSDTTFILNITSIIIIHLLQSLIMIMSLYNILSWFVSLQDLILTVIHHTKMNLSFMAVYILQSYYVLFILL